MIKAKKKYFLMTRMIGWVMSFKNKPKIRKRKGNISFYCVTHPKRK